MCRCVFIWVFWVWRWPIHALNKKCCRLDGVRMKLFFVNFWIVHFNKKTFSFFFFFYNFYSSFSVEFFINSSINISFILERSLFYPFHTNWNWIIKICFHSKRKKKWKKNINLWILNAHIMLGNFSSHYIT